MSLPHDDVQIFNIYQTWLNTGELRYNFDDEEWWMHLAKLWVFADKICSPQLRNKTTDAFFNVVAQNCDLQFAEAQTVHYVWENTMPGSYLRRILVRFFFYIGRYPEVLSLYPHEFLSVSLGRAMDKVNLVPKGNLPKSSLYHQNCSEPCCSK